MIRPIRVSAFAAAAGLLIPTALRAQQPPFTLEQVMSAPFPDELVAAPAGGAVAWISNARGARNIWVAAPPDYQGKPVTSYAEDDGQEIGELQWTPDARAIAYVRGGDLNDKGEYPNPQALVAGVEQAVWIVPVTGGTPRRIGEGNARRSRRRATASRSSGAARCGGPRSPTPAPPSNSSTRAAAPARYAGRPTRRSSPS